MFIPIFIDGCRIFPKDTKITGHSTNHECEVLVDEVLAHKRVYITAIAFPERNLFRRTFIEPHLDKDGYIEKDHWNVLFTTPWKGKDIHYALFDITAKQAPPNFAAQLVRAYCLLDE
jgi:hypothetical protein